MPFVLLDETVIHLVQFSLAVGPMLHFGISTFKRWYSNTSQAGLVSFILASVSLIFKSDSENAIKSVDLRRYKQKLLSSFYVPRCILCQLRHFPVLFRSIIARASILASPCIVYTVCVSLVYLHLCIFV